MSNKRYKDPISRHEQTQTKTGLNSLLWMFVGAIIAVMVGVFFYLSPLFDGYRNEVDVNPDVKVTPLPQQETSSAADYEFYEILPNRNFANENIQLDKNHTNTSPDDVAVDVVVQAPKQESEPDITVVEEDATYDEPAQTTQEKPDVSDGDIHIQKSNRTYVLQVRSYDNAQDADRKRAEVIMAGVDVKVVRRVDSTGMEIYQVVSAPMNSREAAMRARQRLSENGIDVLIIEQQHE